VGQRHLFGREGAQQVAVVRPSHERLIAQVKDWLESDSARRAPVDRRRLAEALFDRLAEPVGCQKSGLGR
jgi:hypothetical protein